MYILAIIIVKILFLIEWSYAYPQLCFIIESRMVNKFRACSLISSKRVQAR